MSCGYAEQGLFFFTLRRSLVELVEWLERVVAAAAVVGGRPEATARHSLGITLEKVGRYAEASEQHQTALPLAEACGDEDLALACMIDQGTVERLAGNLAEAILLYKVARYEAAERKITRWDGHLLAHLSTCEIDVGRPERAVPLAQEAVALARASGVRFSVMADLTVLGRALKAARRPDDSRKCYEEALGRVDWT